MKMIVGLGNPGKQYAKNRHNLGFLFLEYLENIYGFKISKSEHEALTYTCDIDNEKIIFVKPQTYMNLSGNSIIKIKNYYKIENEDILIIFDDVDIPFGTFRYRQNGSAGTHNGMKSIISLLNSNDIKRIKIGIGNIKNENEDLKDFVLGNFSKDQLDVLNNVFGDVHLKVKEFINNKL